MLVPLVLCHRHTRTVGYALFDMAALALMQGVVMLGLCIASAFDLVHWCKRAYQRMVPRTFCGGVDWRLYAAWALMALSRLMLACRLEILAGRLARWAYRLEEW